MDQLQALVDGMSGAWQRERSASQMTLGKLIAALEQLPPDSEVDALISPHSYRGYYEDLAFEPSVGIKQKASEALDVCKGAMGQVFVGYKGGDFVMGALTPIWCATYSCCGQKIMALENGFLILANDDD